MRVAEGAMVGHTSPYSAGAALRYLSDPEVHRPVSIAEAVMLLAELGPAAAPLAGGTWIMRSQIRGEPYRPAYISLHGLAPLSERTLGEPTVLGALLTHSQLTSLGGALSALGEAAAKSAFPAVRSVATLGGNICSRPFPEADLVPALLALDAEVELATGRNSSWLPLSTYMASRDRRGAGELLTRVRAGAPRNRVSAYERLTVRAGSEYALASIAVAMDLNANLQIEGVRVVAGSIADQARTWRAAEETLAGSALSTEIAEKLRSVSTDEFEPREGLDAPGWYRLGVLPVLLTRAVLKLARGHMGR